MNIIRRFAAVVGSSILTVALAPGAAHAAAPSVVPLERVAVTKTVETVVTAADLAPVLEVATNARSGEGMIRITTRVCGSAAGWPAVAARNGVTPPVYLVLLGQRIVVTCTSGGTIAQAQAPPVRAAPPAAASGWVAPVRACVVSGFGMRWGRMHWGTDLSAGYGTAIRAAASGTVSTAYQAGGAVNYTMINHGNGLMTVYMHQSRFAVRSGWVSAGQVVGYVGSTGNSTGPHLHFEVHTGGAWNGRVNPVGFMAARGAPLGC